VQRFQNTLREAKTLDTKQTKETKSFSCGQTPRGRNPFIDRQGIARRDPGRKDRSFEQEQTEATESGGKNLSCLLFKQIRVLIFN
jgi:hypothetical protein